MCPRVCGVVNVMFTCLCVLPDGGLVCAGEMRTTSNDPTLLNPFNPSFPHPFHPNARRVRTWSQRRRQWRLPPRQRCADSRLMGHESHSNSDAHTLFRLPASPLNAPHVPTHTHTQVAPLASPSTTKTKDDVQEVPRAALQVRPKDVIRACMCVWSGGW